MKYFMVFCAGFLLMMALSRYSIGHRLYNAATMTDWEAGKGVLFSAAFLVGAWLLSRVETKLK